MNFSETWFETVISLKPWNYDISVNKNTGALSINLIHLSAISFRRALIKTHGTLSIFEVKSSKICLSGATESLLEDVRYPGDDHLFILASDRNTVTYFILRDLGSGSYRFIASCADLFMVELEKFKSELYVKSLHREIEKILLWHNEPSSLHDVRDYYRLRRELAGEYNYMLIGFLPGIKSFWELIPVYRGLLNEEDGSAPDFEELYLSCIGQEF